MARLVYMTTMTTMTCALESQFFDPQSLFVNLTYGYGILTCPSALNYNKRMALVYTWVIYELFFMSSTVSPTLFVQSESLIRLKIIRSFVILCIDHKPDEERTCHPTSDSVHEYCRRFVFMLVQASRRSSICRKK